MTEPELKFEKEKLATILKQIKELLKDRQEELKRFEEDFIGSREDLWRMKYQKEVHIKNIEYSVNKPYFARIDFQYADNGKKESIYIGKNGIAVGPNIIVVDWRAPISSLYYDSEVGECSFEAPEGVIKGQMDLKRQFEIEDGVLLNYYDEDLVSNDSLLQKYLNDNNDSRLKSIVSTIQKEQNEVIRKKLYDNLIIQGVAGSGKTTVALHRIAYLVYNYIKSVSQNQYLVIGPNPVFLKYIKSVLPDLDVSEVNQSTFEEFAKLYIKEELKINPADKKVNLSIGGKINTDIDKFKCSMKYKYMLDEFLKIYISNLTQKDLKLDNFIVISNEKITELFNLSSSNASLESRIELTINRMVKYIEDNLDDIISKYNDYNFEIFKNASTLEEKDKLRNIFAKNNALLKKGARSLIRKYFTNASAQTTKLYKLFISTIENYNIFNYQHLPELKKNTLASLKTSSYDFEDLAALIYIKSIINPNKDYEKMRHVVVDEAQDLGEFNFYVLKQVLPAATFSIFGDLAQSIYDYRSIDNWERVNAVMFDSGAEIINFGKSYRTTAEIMAVADDVALWMGLNKSDLVVRHGNDVTFNKMTAENIPKYIKKKVEDFKAKGYKTIAIISKTHLMSCYINDDLQLEGMKIPNVTINDDVLSDEFAICTISNQLAKGLEFDAVIINDASENIYSSTNNLDMKLLYVAITRALHELDIIYTNELTKPLQKRLTKER